MREYFIYKINEDVAEEYFGKEIKLFQLFLEEYKTFTVQKDILLKQIHYITSPLQPSPLQSFIKQMLLSSKGFQAEAHSFLLECEKSSARLSFSERYMILQSVGSFEAETAIFENIRKYERCFFAMDFKYYRYGWLNPLKARTGYGS
ncbi:MULTISPECIES: sporulation inhibitor of replication protein SirA [Fictibacillus]|uniref:Sporulation inhibitor of replication protein SirA n=1 Tax=Fictibacillus terranigra TaxID=3058424 RepID=A0ABT8E5W7_9BACL|nr:sporulation inhibitor of replication protein SirA [Fictibacillus sp. CENA-BCM004]MDN4073305.1 sporulation inhibitor of replication protein SirA [Fictibacillus sp. CENA-BCM004]